MAPCRLPAPSALSERTSTQRKDFTKFYEDTCCVRYQFYSPFLVFGSMTQGDDTLRALHFCAAKSSADSRRLTHQKTPHPRTPLSKLSASFRASCCRGGGGGGPGKSPGVRSALPQRLHAFQPDIKHRSGFSRGSQVQASSDPKVTAPIAVPILVAADFFQITCTAKALGKLSPSLSRQPAALHGMQGRLGRHYAEYFGAG